MTSRSRRPALAVLALCVLAVPACGDDDERPAPVADCGLVAFTPQSDDGAFQIRARGVGCPVARRVARAARDVRAGASASAGAKPRYSAEGFDCEGRATDEELAGVAYRCTRDGASVTFTRN